MHMCPQLDPDDICITALHYFASHYFFSHNSKSVGHVLCIFIVVWFYTRLIRLNKVKTGRGLLTGCNGLLYGTV